MKLLYSPNACSLAPHIVARELGMSLDLVRVDLNQHRTAQGEDLYQLNPKGQVPLLQLANGEYLSEGPVIAQYLADSQPGQALLPAAGSLDRVRVVEWQNYISTELHKSYTPLFNPQVNAEAKRVLSALLRKKYVWLDSVLAGREFLHGERFSVADAYLFVVTRWAAYVQLDLTDLPHLQHYMQAIAARPAVQAALQAEG